MNTKVKEFAQEVIAKLKFGQYLGDMFVSVKIVEFPQTELGYHQTVFSFRCKDFMDHTVHGFTFSIAHTLSCDEVKTCIDLNSKYMLLSTDEVVDRVHQLIQCKYT